MEVNKSSAKYLSRNEPQLTELGPLPTDWSVATVGDEFHVQLGKMLDSDKNVGTPKPFLGNRAVQWGRIDVSDIGEIRMSPSDLQRYRLERGDLLVCEGGEVGRSAIWRGQLEECYYQKALHRLRAKRGYSQEFMAAVLEQFARIGKLQDYVTQTSIAHLPKEKFVALPIPKPATEDEQRRISQAICDVDALVDSLGQLLNKKRQIKQGAMQKLLTGKRRLPGFSDPWRRLRLHQLGTFLKGAGIKRDEAATGDLPCVRYGEIYTAHSDHIRTFHSWISRSVASTATKLQLGDLLFAGSGETKEEIGKCVAFLDDVEAFAGGDIVILRPTSDVNSMFMGYLLNTSAVVCQKASRGQGDAVVHISATALGDVRIELPPSHEQKAIAQVLSDLDTDIEALELRLTKARALKQAMAQALLTGRIRLVKPQT